MTTTTTTKTAEELSAAVHSILSDNTKLRKMPNGARIINAGVTMAPSKRSGVVNVCAHATAGCILVCVLWFAGRTVTRIVREAATKRTRLWHYYPEVFYKRLHRELNSLARRAAKLGVQPYCRTNVASDIDHPREVYDQHPETVFYNYSKSVEQMDAYTGGELPQNYHVSYSVNEESTFANVSRFLRNGANVVVVFDSHYFAPLHRYGAIPDRVEFRGPSGDIVSVDTVDGDIHDIRTPAMDGRGVCVCLRAKGSNSLRQKARDMGFVRRHEDGANWYVDEHRKSGTAVVELK